MVSAQACFSIRIFRPTHSQSYPNFVRPEAWQQTPSIAAGLRCGPICCSQHSMLPALVQILIEQGASFRFLFENTCKDAYTRVRRHFGRPFQRTNYLMLRYLFYHNMWRCYLASCIQNADTCLPDVRGLNPRFGTMIKSFLQECSRNERLGIQAPLNGPFQRPWGFPCLLAQFRTGCCTHCVFRRDVWLTYSGGELRMRRIDMRIFDTRPAAIFGERSSN